LVLHPRQVLPDAVRRLCSALAAVHADLKVQLQAEPQTVPLNAASLSLAAGPHARTVTFVQKNPDGSLLWR
jgi:hypothetical protein